MHKNINICHYTTTLYYGIFTALFVNNFTISSLKAASLEI